MAPKPITRLLYAGLYANVVVFTFPAHAGTIASSLEQYNYQTGDSTLTLRSYDAFDEYHGPIDINGVSGVNGLSVAINGGTATTIAYNPQYETFKQRQSWNNVNDMIVARPVDATYTHTHTERHAHRLGHDYCPRTRLCRCHPGQPAVHYQWRERHLEHQQRGSGRFHV